jgi:hypothetical protein
VGAWEEDLARRKALRFARAYVAADRVGVLTVATTDGASIEGLDGEVAAPDRAAPGPIGRAVREALDRKSYYGPAELDGTWKEIAARRKKLVRRFGAKSERQLSADFVMVDVTRNPDGTTSIVATRGDGRGSYHGADVGPPTVVAAMADDAELGRAVLASATAAPLRTE